MTSTLALVIHSALCRFCITYRLDRPLLPQKTLCLRSFLSGAHSISAFIGFYRELILLFMLSAHRPTHYGLLVLFFRGKGWHRSIATAHIHFSAPTLKESWPHLSLHLACLPTFSLFIPIPAQDFIWMNTFLKTRCIGECGWIIVQYRYFWVINTMCLLNSNSGFLGYFLEACIIIKQSKRIFAKLKDKVYFNLIRLG